MFILMTFTQSLRLRYQWYSVLLLLDHSSANAFLHDTESLAHCLISKQVVSMSEKLPSELLWPDQL